MSSRRDDNSRHYKHTSSKRHQEDDNGSSGYETRRKAPPQSHHNNKYRDNNRSPERQQRHHGGHHRRRGTDSDNDDDRRDKRPRHNHHRDDDNNSRHRKKSTDAEHEWGGGARDGPSSGHQKKKPAGKKEEPNFETTGKLAEDTNTFNGVVIKYSEPAEARKPKRRWRLYPFKGEKQLPVLHIHRQSGYLLGRDRKVADIPIDHPSSSKQHAVLQYRLISVKKDGRHIRCIRPYIIDLESANGTYVNNQRIEPKKYVELMEKDVIKFGFSSREYVLLHEHSTDSGDDDSLAEEDPNEDSTTVTIAPTADN